MSITTRDVRGADHPEYMTIPEHRPHGLKGFCGYVHLTLGADDLAAVIPPLTLRAAHQLDRVHDVLVMVDTIRHLPIEVRIEGAEVSTAGVQALADVLSGLRHRQGGSGFVTVVPAHGKVLLTIGALEIPSTSWEAS